MRRRLSYANVMSTIAVFGVLAGGGAWAASKIGPRDILPRAIRAPHVKPNAVRAPHIAPGQVRPGHLNVFVHRRAQGTLSTDLAERGPGVTLRPPPGSLIAVYAAMEGRTTSGTTFDPSDQCTVSLLERPVSSGGTARRRAVLIFPGETFHTRVTTHAPPVGSNLDQRAGTTRELEGSWRVFPPFSPGERTTYLFRYEHPVFGSCEFRDRRLWLAVLR